MKLLSEDKIFGDGYVRLYDVSSFSTRDEVEKIVSNIAGICYNKEKNKNIFSHLIRKGHLSPFEFIRVVNLAKGLDGKIENSLRNKFCLIDMIEYNIPKEHKQRVALFELKIPIFVARQLMRYRSFSYMELSRRYVKDDLEFYNFINFNEVNYGDEYYEDNFAISVLFDLISEAYYKLLERGFKKEQARTILPVSLYTKMYVMVEISGFFNFALQRLHVHAQEEIRVLCKTMIDVLYNNQRDFGNIEFLYNIISGRYDGNVFNIRRNSDFIFSISVDDGCIIDCDAMVKELPNKTI